MLQVQPMSFFFFHTEMLVCHLTAVCGKTSMLWCHKGHSTPRNRSASTLCRLLLMRSTLRKTLVECRRDTLCRVSGAKVSKWPTLPDSSMRANHNLQFYLLFFCRYKQVCRNKRGIKLGLVSPFFKRQSFLKKEHVTSVVLFLFWFFFFFARVCQRNQH